MEHVTHRDDGTEQYPTSESEWREWVSASKTRNYLIDDPVLDWLQLYGSERGYLQDDELPDYDKRFDFTEFIFAKARKFEKAVFSWLGDHWDFVLVSGGWADTQNLGMAKQTFEELNRGREIVAQGVLWNPETRTYGAPDLLVRYDVLCTLFPDLASRDAIVTPSNLSNPAWHYRVVDIKYTTLKLLKDGHASSKHRAYMAQVWLYNEALGRLQEVTPPAAYLLGRAWQTSKERGDAAMDRVARVDRNYKFRGAGTLTDIVSEATDWIRQVRSDGNSWLLHPDEPEVKPNLANEQDGPWHAAKQTIATELGITEPRHPITDPLLKPIRVQAAADRWRTPAQAEFFVDFETVTDLDDDFSRFPRKGSTPVLFMIGCGHFADPNDPDSWIFHTFLADRMDEASERVVIDEWLAHMEGTCAAHGTSLREARLFHWSHHEASFLGGAYNACAERHGCPEWKVLPWVDLLREIFQAEPIIVAGTAGNGLKEIAGAMHEAGLIRTAWGDGPADGLGAQAGAWWCSAESRRKGCSLADIDLMESIREYNEIDCRVMAEVLGYLREHR